MKPIDWKRRADLNGEYGCLGDLGMHALHLPLRADWTPENVRAILSDVVTERPDGAGGWADCDTWDNAVLLCEARDGDVSFPLRIETKRIAPGEMNTWVTEIDGTEGSIAFSTKLPKTLRFMEYRPGGQQAWQTLDLGSQSAYPTITGAIFEFGFSDAILQMWAAFLDELAHGREGMRQPFHCDARGGGFDTGRGNRSLRGCLRPCGLKTAIRLDAAAPVRDSRAVDDNDVIDDDDDAVLTATPARSEEGAEALRTCHRLARGELHAPAERGARARRR